jgi:hypothetical protein
MEDDENALREAAVYNVEEDEWKLLPDMSQEQDPCFGVFIEGKFFVIGGFNNESVDGLEWNTEV